MSEETEGGALLLSALVDGQLHGAEFAKTLEWLGRDEQARLTWHAYHVVGDVLRSGEANFSLHDATFLQRLRLGLQREAPPPGRSWAVSAIPAEEIAAASELASGSRNRVANDASGGWKWLAGFASLALVAVIGWQLVAGLAVQPEQPQLVMIRDPQLDALLAAHRQSGGVSALQMSAGFLRNATFEASSR